MNLEQLAEEFKKTMVWSPEATEYEKTLVLGNINGFTAFLKERLGWQPLPEPPLNVVVEPPHELVEE